MKELLSLIKKPIFAILFGFLFTALLCSLMVFGLIMPGFSSWQEGTKANKDLETKVSKVSQNITLAKGVNDSERKSYTEVMDIFYPVAADYLHFATLNENLAAQMGVSVTSFTNAQTSSSAAAAKAPSIGPAAGSSSSSSSSAASVAPAATLSSIYVSVAYKGQFESVESFIRNLTKLDRLIGLSTMVFTKVENTNEITANATFTLPLSAKSTAASTSEDIQLLSLEDKKILEEIKSKIEFFANPADTPIGKTDPFN